MFLQFYRTGLLLSSASGRTFKLTRFATAQPHWGQLLALFLTAPALAGTLSWIVLNVSINNEELCRCSNRTQLCALISLQLNCAPRTREDYSRAKGALIEVGCRYAPVINSPTQCPTVSKILSITRGHRSDYHSGLLPNRNWGT
ncbi:hypothetical protein V1506DRAFT_528738 [Lipomyces tetrasporus]